MEPVGSTPVANGNPASSFNQSRGTIEQPQPFNSQEQVSNTPNRQEAEARGMALGQRPNGIFIIEPNHPRIPESPDVERSTEFFDDKERFDSAVTSSANISLAGLFSPLSSNIYFPALKEISTELNVSLSLAAGSAATIAVGAGVIGDITTPKERGGLIGIFGGIRMLGQSIGPVFGGIITQYLGFRAIFSGFFLAWVR
ncbi:hypothetical protein DID88_008481 [Monilinia fructigena]|uniref:Major facilitator superfamily (MFS) profile domain-containing protein n=1 Tax=Monilinia fructigena TaxID=38457 RepID=A0A395J6H6_9HELO|nr:hypothetical protein DID88_008481 [Monilinia fructigena]